jgi:hypothetical protein
MGFTAPIANGAEIHSRSLGYIESVGCNSSWITLSMMITNDYGGWMGKDGAFLLRCLFCSLRSKE